MHHPHPPRHASRRGPRDSASDAGAFSPDRSLRASDADRERVAGELRDHCEAGRLDADELGQRLETAFAACTLSALDPVLADLPRATRRGPQPRSGDPRRWRRVPILLAALLAISIISGHPVIWLAFPLLFIVVRRRSALRRVNERGGQPVRSVPRAGRGTSLA